MNSREERLAFAAAAHVLAARGSGRSLSSTAMRVYLALFVVAVVGIPVLRALVLAMASPHAIAVVTAESTPAAVEWGAAALLLVVACIGSMRGAIVPRPAYVHFVVRSSLARRLTLRRPVIALHLLAAAVFGAAASIICGALAVAGLALDPLAGALFIVVAATYGVLLATAWLGGQVSGRVRTAAGITLVGFLTATAIAAAVGVADGLVGWFHTLTSAAASGTLVLAAGGIVLAIVVAVVSLTASFAMIGRLHGSELMAQGQAWASASMLVQTGDVRGSLERIRTPARHTPRRVSLHAGPLWWVIVKRDATGSVRHPIRLAIGIAAGALAGIFVAIALSVAPGAGAVIAATAAALAYLSAGAGSDGMRAHADNVGAPVLFGTGTQTLALLHLILPALVSCTVALVGAAFALTWTHGATSTVLVAAPLLAAMAVALRAVSAVKGPLPVTLLLPVPTPVGDVSVLFALAWSFDALLIALALGAGLGSFDGAISIPVLVLAAGAIMAVLAGWGRTRLRRLHP